MFRILVVTENHKATSLFTACREEHDFSVLTAQDRETALQILHHERPDLLIFNLDYPDRDAWNLIHTIQADPILVMIPIIMIARRVNDQDKIFGLEIGVDDFITAPVSSRVMVARVKALLRYCKLQQRAEPGVLHTGKLTIHPNQQEFHVDRKPITLTRTAPARLAPISL